MRTDTLVVLAACGAFLAAVASWCSIGCATADPPQPGIEAERPEPNIHIIHGPDGNPLGVGQVEHIDRPDGTVMRIVHGPNGLTGKYVASLHEAIESRISWVDTLTRDGVVTKPITVYYLFAEDGTFCEVKLSDYAKAKKGLMWYSKHWRKD